jgi:hypothetical protein
MVLLPAKLASTVISAWAFLYLIEAQIAAHLHGLNAFEIVRPVG